PATTGSLTGGTNFAGRFGWGSRGCGDSADPLIHALDRPPLLARDSSNRPARRTDADPCHKFAIIHRNAVGARLAAGNGHSPNGGAPMRVALSFLLLLAVARPASAQTPDFLFGRPHGTIST